MTTLKMVEMVVVTMLLTQFAKMVVRKITWGPRRIRMRGSVAVIVSLVFSFIMVAWYSGRMGMDTTTWQIIWQFVRVAVFANAGYNLLEVPGKIVERAIFGATRK